MSVLACSRRGCESIMCDRLSSEHGYICYNCFEELVDSGPTTNIKEFMNNSSKLINTEEEARARYDAVFENTYD